MQESPHPSHVNRLRNPAQTRSGLLRAAFDEMQRSGYRGADLEAILRRAGVTKGAMLDGVRYDNGFVTTETVVMTSSNRTVRRVLSRRPV